MTTEAPFPALCPYHPSPKDAPLRELPELHPIMVPDQPGKPKLVWACQPCATKLAAAGTAMRCITEQRG